MMRHLPLLQKRQRRPQGEAMNVTITMDVDDWHEIETALILAAETYADGKYNLADNGQGEAAAAYAGRAKRYRALGEAIRRHIEPAV